MDAVKTMKTITIWFAMMLAGLTALWSVPAWSQGQVTSIEEALVFGAFIMLVHTMILYLIILNLQRLGFYFKNRHTTVEQNNARGNMFAQTSVLGVGVYIIVFLFVGLKVPPIVGLEAGQVPTIVIYALSLLGISAGAQFGPGIVLWAHYRKYSESLELKDKQAEPKDTASSHQVYTHTKARSRHSKLRIFPPHSDCPNTPVGASQ